ncbi:hypothetical protein lerEdw1_008585 [Lerista edwardsae]|nr:hypothetical protein lerEdw1_008585 [Lerista edwardsae]
MSQTQWIAPASRLGGVGVGAGPGLASSRRRRLKAASVDVAATKAPPRLLLALVQPDSGCVAPTPACRQCRLHAQGLLCDHASPYVGSFPAKMSTVHDILSKLTLEGDHALPPSAYATIKAYPNFDADRDAAALETAIKTKGVDEVTIVNILTNRSNEQRQDIAFAYQRRTKKELPAALKSALSGHLENVMLGLLKTPAQYDASELKASMKGLGTDEDSLIEIICSRNNQELALINKAYKEMYKTELEKDIISDTSGDFRKLMVALAKGRRNEDASVVDYELIDQDARDLYDAGVKRKGTDVPKWINIMTERSIPHLQKVFERYKSYSPYDMLESIKKEVKGDLENAFLNLVQCIQNKQLYFADRLYDSMKGKGTKDKILTRIMVSRAEVDMLKIKSEFKRKYGKSLYYFIQGVRVVVVGRQDCMGRGHFNEEEEEGVQAVENLWRLEKVQEELDCG